jgi:hypothetical protein
MDIQNIYSITPTAFYLIGIIAGLWVAKGFLAKLVVSIDQVISSNIFSRRSVRLLLWLALGSLFAAPIAEILAALQSFFTLIFWTDALSASGLGQTRDFVLIWLTLVLMVMIYGIVIWAGTESMESLEYIFWSKAQFTPIEKTFFLLVIASLIYQFAKGIILGIILLPAYNPAYWNTLNITGFILTVSAGVGVLVVLILILYLNA